jgi:hypothetical protein
MHIFGYPAEMDSTEAKLLYANPDKKEGYMG